MNPDQTMNIQSLKSNLLGVMPVLDANLAAAHSEYMAGDIPAGAFHYVRSRHLTACAVVSRDDLEVEDAYKACAFLAIDLRTGIKELTGSVKDQVDAWWQCYRDAGFTELHPFFEAPMLPSTLTKSRGTDDQAGR